MTENTAAQISALCDASDDQLHRALAEANIPALMNALVHLTGDLSLIRGAIRPDVAAIIDQQCGISEDQQADARALAFETLRSLTDEARTHALTEAQVEEMVAWLVGVPLPAEYTEFLIEELALHAQDPYATPGLDQLDAERKRDFHVVVIGAGMSGLLAAHRLRQAGFSFTVFDKNPEVGGTWFENSYPGCRVDSPNHTYTYSFRPNAWPYFYSPRPVLREYFNRCADEFEIRESMRLGCEVRRAVWDEASKRWQITVAEESGAETQVEANALISAVGQLNRPKLPEIEGVGRFSGPCFHSARWDHGVDLAGKRVGVIGTGASAFQFIPEIAKAAARIDVFQRTPPWIRPTEEYHERVSDGKHWLLENVPFYGKWYRFLMFWLAAEGMLEAAKVDPAWDNGGLSVSEANEELRQLLLQNLQAHLADHPDLLASSTPSYPPAGKRMLFDNGTWLSTLKQDHVALITNPIERIEESGVVTTESEAETLHEIDVLIYGTGFETNRMLASLEIVGRNGEVLGERWLDDPRAYLGITVPSFPNLFCLYGPNTNIVVNGSIIFFSECEVRYTLSCLGALVAAEKQALDPKPEILDAFIERVDEGNRGMAWGSPNVRSWYKNEAGRVTQNWPFSLVEYWNLTKAPNLDDYRLL